MADVELTGSLETSNDVKLEGDVKFTPTLVQVAWGKIVGTLANQEDLKEALDTLNSQDVALSSLIDREEQRAIKRENAIELEASDTYATKVNLIAETTRATGVEKTLENSISSEASARAKADSTLQSNIDNEIARAKARENEIEKKIPSHDNFATKTELNAEVTRAKGVEEAKANKTDVYTKAEVDKLIQALVDSINANTYLVVKK